MSQIHKQLADAIRMEAQKRFMNRVRLWERHAGLVYTKNGRPIHSTVNGMWDLYGWVVNGDRSPHVEMECKVAGDSLSRDQEAWGAMLKATRVPHRVIHIRGEEDIQVGVETAMMFLASIMDAA